MGNAPIYGPNHSANPSAVKANSLVWLADESPRDKPWDDHHSSASQIAIMLSRSADKWHQQLASRMCTCAPWLQFSDAINRETGEIKFKLTDASFCRVRMCPICQWRRALRWSARMLEALPEIEKAYPSHRWLMLTLTVKNCELDDLAATLKVIRYGWRKMTGVKAWPAVGAIRGLEITRGQDGLAHPHFHALLLVPGGYFGSSGGYLKHEQWRAMWKKALKLDYDPMVNIQPIKADQAKLRGAISETLKYSVKPSDLTGSPEWLFAITDALHRVRSIEVFGKLKPFFKEMEKEESADLIGEDDGGLIEDTQKTFRWNEPAQRYGRSRARTIHDEARDYRIDENRADKEWKQAAEEAEKQFQKPR